MGSYYRDPDYPDFWWVNTTYDRMLENGGPFWRIQTNIPIVNSTRFITKNFRPDLHDTELKIIPDWVEPYRIDWIPFMRRNSPAKKPKKLKPNPAFGVLQRLSGLSGEQISSIISFFGGE